MGDLGYYKTYDTEPRVVLVQLRICFFFDGRFQNKKKYWYKSVDETFYHSVN